MNDTKYVALDRKLYWGEDKTSFENDLRDRSAESGNIFKSAT